MEIPVLSYSSKSELYSDLETVKDKYVSDGIVVLRGLHFTEPEQGELTLSLGDLIGWFPNHSSSDIGRKYTESHSGNQNVAGSKGDQIVLDWHIEHVDYDQQCPLVAGLWNMWHFNCAPGTGLTYFVDTTEVFKLLTEEEQAFLSASKISWVDAYGFGPHLGLAVVPHWLTGIPTIRIEITKHVKTDLVSVNEGTATEQHSAEFKRIYKKIIDLIETNQDIRMTHQWEHGDIVIPDLFKLAHAVTGGFDPKDRSFTGHWLFSKDPTILTDEELPYAWR